MHDMRYFLNLLETQTLSESVTAKPWTLYHGTKSKGFATFKPTNAVKGEQFWNPLGNGMYATNDPHFAGQFGGNVYEVIIPAGTNYKRINSKDWVSIGRSIVFTALKKAMMACGLKGEYGYTIRPKPDWKIANMDRSQMEKALLDYYVETRNSNKDAIIAAMVDKTDEDLGGFLTTILKDWNANNRIFCDEQQSKLSEFRWNLRLDHYTPYEGLFESTACVDVFGPEIAEKYAEILPSVSDAKFRKFDMVIFSETNNIFQQYDEKERPEETWEVVIYKPDLQRTSRLYDFHRY